MTDQTKPTTVSVKMLSTRAEFREAYLRTLDENETLKAKQEQERMVLQAEIDAADRRIRALKTERDALIADVRSALHAIEHEGPRLAALRVMGEKAKAEAERDALKEELKEEVERLKFERDNLKTGTQLRMEAAEAALAELAPLVEAVIETDIAQYHGMDTDCPIIRQALAYLEKRAGKEEGEEWLIKSAIQPER